MLWAQSSVQNDSLDTGRRGSGQHCVWDKANTETWTVRVKPNWWCLCHCRHQKCRTCCKQLKNLSNMVKNKAVQVGRHGSAFRELQLLMAPLDDVLWDQTCWQLLHYGWEINSTWWSLHESADLQQDAAHRQKHRQTPQRLVQRAALSQILQRAQSHWVLEEKLRDPKCYWKILKDSSAALKEHVEEILSFWIREERCQFDEQAGKNYADYFESLWTQVAAFKSYELSTRGAVRVQR